MASLKISPCLHLYRTFSYKCILLLKLLFLVQFAQGQGPGNNERITFKIAEGLPPQTQVGTIPVKPSRFYYFSEESPLFHLEGNTGEITTKVILDRESLVPHTTVNLLILTHQSDIIEVEIIIQDINDNPPTFQDSVINIYFTETNNLHVPYFIKNAKDPDNGENGTVIDYAIVSGNSEGKFQILFDDKISPLPCINNALKIDRDQDHAFYIMNISAKDGGTPPKFGYVTVNITILDFNDNPPEFDQSEYLASVNESAAAGHTVIRVAASDKDSGRNARISYSLHDPAGQFKIDEHTGTIVTTKPSLKCLRDCGMTFSLASTVSCQPRSCLLTVEAFDHGNQALSDRAYVTVNIIDENDHDPKITFLHIPDETKSFSAVDENAKIASPVAIISVEDQDDGKNGETYLQIASGNSLNHFEVVTIGPQNTLSQVVRVMGNLDREKISKYNITFKAFDRGVPPRSSTAFLIIYVNDVNDHAPEFDQLKYSVTVSELLPVGSFVESVSAKDADLGLNSEIKYKIVAGNDRQWFKINSKTGLVTTADQLDFEVMDHIVMNISAEDNGFQPFINYTSVTVTIQDENDMAPKFPQDTYNIIVDENLAPGYEIITATAVDNDQGKNGSVYYNFHPDVNQIYPNTFQLNSNTGRITTMISLDREQIAHYKIKLIARDQGSPALSSTATIFVSVNDINDNSPKFYPTKYYADVMERSAIGTQIIPVKAIDLDIGVNGLVEYSILSGSNGVFTVDKQSGWVTTTVNTLQRSKVSFYELFIQARDKKGRVSENSAVVQITVLDRSTQPPSFTSSIYTFTAMEERNNAFSKQNVGTVALSSDGSDLSLYHFSITEGDPEGIFSIGSLDGKIKSVKHIDREERPVYSLKVIASKTGLFAETTVNISITDINDNPPKFKSASVDVPIDENLAVGNAIYLAKAFDPDANLNAEISYTLTSAVNNFKINGKTGIIYLNKAVEKSQGKAFSMSVLATDAGTPQLQSSMQVKVFITDVNDHTPVFSKTSYDISLFESEPVNSRFFKVSATDSDTGRNGQIIYNITRGNDGGRFGIFPDGALYIAQTLDRETRDLYMLTVCATDQGLSPRKSAVNITIHVLDSNDNSPSFINSTFTFSVYENQPGGVRVGVVHANDNDIERNAEITYSIPIEQSNFTIDTQTGEIKTLKSFNREYVIETSGRDFYEFEVTASDNGRTRLKDNALVQVFILDKNDNHPQFTSNLFETSIPENQKVGTPVLRVMATDSDSKDTGNGVLTYTFVSGNEDERFHMNSATGQINLMSTVDRESQDVYELIVNATDSGFERRLMSSTRVLITITDVNDNAPLFAHTSFEASFLESTPPGELVGLFEATDVDMGNNKAITYSITGGNIDDCFGIDTNTGKLYLTNHLDYERRKSYKLNITASDAGDPQLATYVPFRVHVLDVNDNAPVFESQPKVVQIREDRALNDIITTVTANDADSNENGRVSYRITKLSPSGSKFGIRSNGEIFVSGILDREEVDVYNLTIMAEDQAVDISLRKTSEKTIKILIDDVNDNAPQFISSSAVTINAQSTSGSLLTTILAHDKDSASNGIVSYELRRADFSLFRMDADGKLYIKRDLPPIPVVHKVTVRAKDNGYRDPAGSRSTSMEFSLIVAAQDSSLSFSKNVYSGFIDENANSGTSILKVKAESTNSDARIEYYVTSVTSGDIVQWSHFTINKNTGVLSSTRGLDREKQPDSYTVEIYAVDLQGDRPRTKSIQAQVTLRDKNDSPPQFSSSLYTANVFEDTAVGKTVARVTVNDPDETGTVQLRIIGGNDDSSFTITDDGAIRLAKPLDREKKAQYNLNVQANDGLQSRTAGVNIRVSDINDNAPVFSKAVYSFDIPENTPVGTTVDAVVATDADDGLNGQVSYQLVSDWGRDIFQLDPRRGTFTLSGGLDFEDIQLYTLRVKAQDGGTSPESSTITVFMNIKDVNDNTPVFDPMSYNQEISEDVNIGFPVLNVSATDIDSGLNSRIQYSIVDGDEKGHFSIHATDGTILTAGTLDREKQSVYNLVVKAEDQAESPNDRLYTTAMASIVLRDVNDCFPEFLSPTKIWVRENTAVNSIVFTIQAQDKDEGQNGLVTYSITPTSNYPFTIGTTDGKLKLNTALDRETTSSVLLEIIASDNGSPSKSSSMELTIMVEDENDNNPVFYPKNYRFTLSEQAEVGTTFLSVSATDRDSGLNGMVRYFIIDGDSNFDFSIDHSTGKLRIQKPLDYERVNKYSLVIQAEDSGTTPRYDTATATITILDVNDNKPVFVDSPYYANVRENMLDLPVPVIQLSARDDDSPINSRLSYDIRDFEDSNIKNIFGINSTTGQITAKQTLDREIRSQYTLLVIATDSGSPKFTGTGTVSVSVQDVNDNSPVFDRNETYVGHVLEGLSPQTEVLTVTATDRDEGSNAQILYRLEDSAGGKFTIHPDTGRIVTMTILDREEVDQYHLSVVARDNGMIPRETTASVLIHVDDSNDNAPHFDQPSYSQSIYDPTDAGQFIVGVTAVDRDVGNNGRVFYSIISGTTDSGKFSIDNSTGIITAAQRLTGLNNVYNIEVKATDQGTNPLSEIISINIQIAQYQSTKKPTFRPIQTGLSIPENTKIGSFVTRVTAESTVSSVNYHIAGGNIKNAFSIDENTGIIKASGAIDYETTESFKLWIEARDRGSPNVHSNYASVDITVSDVNDNTPRFTKSVYNTSIYENVNSGSTLIKLSATDEDSGGNGQVKYRIISGSTNNNFHINENSGLITTQYTIDRETLDNYTLLVEARDQGNPSLSATATVFVTVLDMNDNYPKFESYFSASIPEDIEVGSFILQVTSSDADTGKNALTNYSLVSNPGGKFAIDRTSGNLTVAGTFDAEKVRRYQVEVSVTDGLYRSTVSVSIRINDINDNAPVFNQPLTFNVQEQQTPPTFVGYITANDSDSKHPNNEVYFTLKLPYDAFKIDHNNIFATKALTYVHSEDGPSTTNRHELIVVATDLGTPPRSTETIVVVNVVDANNHAPVFEESSYFSAVPENSNVDDSILQVKARDDKDFGINAEVEYFLDSGNGTQYFKINKLTGLISLKSSISGQQNKNFMVVVAAKDKGTDIQSSTVSVNFKVTDVNRNAPVFMNTKYSETVKEDASIGHKIDTLTAIDGDTGLNGKVTFQIVHGNEKELFFIDSVKGYLLVNKELDYDTVPQHKLNISARDAGLLYKQTFIIYTINLKDVNDNNPQFNQTNYEAYIEENSPRGTLVAQVFATDEDSGNNAVIEYALVPDSSTASRFAIDQDTGVITLQGSVDYELTNFYTIQVLAMNPVTQGITHKKSTTTVSVYIEGVNEFNPKFEEREYNFRVSESAQIGSSIGSVRARDKDKGEDGIVYYFLMGSSNLKGFKVDYKTGLITVSGQPDYESSQVIILDIMAKNWGSVKGDDVDICQARISIQDANDSPVFTRQLYTASIPESSLANTFVVEVEASDNDAKQQDMQFSYTILRGNVDNSFKIDPAFGRISTTGHGLLDRERISIYNITVGAIDTGSPPQTGSASVQIHLSDINDNPPSFSSLTLTGYVYENEAVGTTVIRLSEHTTDADLPEQQNFTFRSIDDPVYSFFKIEAHHGIVTTLKVLNREITPSYVVPVVVVDGGSPTMSTTLSFTVNVKDRNDNSPSSRPLKVLLALHRDFTPQNVVADLRPLDADTTGDYSCLLNGDDLNTFRFAQQSCDLEVRKIPEIDNYSLRVTGTDGVHGSVAYNVEISIMNIDNETLDNTVFVKIQNINVESFLKNKYQLFTTSLASLPLLSNDDIVKVYGLQQNQNDILVSIAVYITFDDIYMSTSRLKQVLNNGKSKLERNADIAILAVDTDVCDSYTCYNGGSCISQTLLQKTINIVDSPSLILSSPNTTRKPSCHCKPGFTGNVCETPLSPCGSLYCQNGGSCGSGNKCVCSAFWTGPECAEDVNECRNNPCKNGGTCKNVEGSFKCLCPEKTHGMFCDLIPTLCSSSPCKNGGTCLASRDSFTCKCAFGYFGVRCQLTSKGFRELSFMKFSPVSSYDEISIRFSTLRQNALLLYNPDTSKSRIFVAVEIISSYVVFSYSVGSYNATTITLPVNVSDGHWHQIDINRKSGLVRAKYCPSGESDCTECRSSICEKYGIPSSVNLNVHHDLLVGGVEDINTLLMFGGQVRNHDFTGCIASLKINNKDILNSPSKMEQGVTNSCQRDSVEGLCSSFVCKNGGTCFDQWHRAHCVCTPGFTGETCEKAKEPFSFGPNSFIGIEVKESYKRDQLLHNAFSNRKKRAVSSDSGIFIRFRTTDSTGLLLYSRDEKQVYSVVWIYDGRVRLSIGMINGNVVSKSSTDVKVSDGEWHNVTVTMQGAEATVKVDGFTVSLPFDYAYDFTSVDVQEMNLGGSQSSVAVDGQSIKDFDGCLSEFKIGGESIPLNGSTPKYQSTVNGNMASGCAALCIDNTCSEGFQCTVTGEKFECVAGPVERKEDMLNIGIIIVIVFFGILLITVIIVFIVFRSRRGMCKKLKGGSGAKTNGNVLGTKSANSSASRSCHDSGYNEQGSLTEDMIIQNHIANQLRPRNGGMGVRPDIIESDMSGRQVLPLEFEDGTVIVEDGEIHLSHSPLHPPNYDELPEHYDLENASSIAPSDIDVATHYQHYRDGPNRKYISPSPNYHQHKNHLHNRHTDGSLNDSKESQSSFHKHRHSRQSPSSLSLNKNSPLVMNNLTRASPASAQSHHSSVNKLSSPGSRTSPFNQFNFHGTPTSPVKSSRTSSEHSLASHPSRASSSTPRLGVLPNGQTVSSSRPTSAQRPYRQDLRGLTCEEINKLNARHHQSPVSLLDGVSSSTEDNLRQKTPNHDSSVLLEPPDSTSDESANDSFTCSEFEYDNNERGKNDFDPMLFPKLTEVEHEIDDHPDNQNYNFGGLYSHRGSIPSTLASDDEHFKPFKPANGSFNWDHLLDWGPSFDKLVGVFKDIALLPDGEDPESELNGHINDHEEYV